MKIKQWLFMIVWWGILFFLPSVWAAERVEILSPNPVGSGARAMSMGGAFIAIADDAAAASWNPGGLIQLEKPEMSAAFGYVHRRENNTSEFSGNQSIQGSDLNYLSVAYPFELGQKRRNMVMSLNYQRLYDFNREWISTDKNTSKKYTQKGDLYALGLAYCIQVTKDFSTGVTLNYWGDSLFKNKWEQSYHYEYVYGKNNDKSITDGQGELYFKGWNMNIGFLFRIGEHWTMGGILKTPFTGSIWHTVIENRINVDSAGSTCCPDSSFQEGEQKLYMPLSYGIGLAYRFSDNFTISADIYQTQWNDFKLETTTGEKVSPITGKDTKSDSTTWFRLGAEYLIVGEKIAIPLRIGIFYDPAPAEGSPDNYYGFSLGSGISCKWFSFDVAYKFRFGNNVNRSMFDDTLTDFSQDVREHTVYMSFIYYF